MKETKPANIQLRLLTGQWTEASAYQAALSFLRLPTSLDACIEMVVSQNDAMAIGVRKALKEAMKDWSWLPFTGGRWTTLDWPALGAGGTACRNRGRPHEYRHCAADVEAGDDDQIAACRANFH